MRKNILLLRKEAGDNRATKRLSKSKTHSIKTVVGFPQGQRSLGGCQTWVLHSGGGNVDLHTGKGEPDLFLYEEMS